MDEKFEFIPLPIEAWEFLSNLLRSFPHTFRHVCAVCAFLEAAFPLTPETTRPTFSLARGVQVSCNTYFFNVLPHHIGVCTLAVSTGVEPASPERQSGVLAVILRDYTAETGAFAPSLRIQARLPPCLIENVGLEPLCCFPKAVCSHYTTFSLSPQPVMIRRFRFGKPVCCQLHHADM